MHNSSFGVAQYGMLSFPLTTGVKADYMGKEVIVKTHTAAHAKFDFVKQFPMEKNCKFRTKIHKYINPLIFSM